MKKIFLLLGLFISIVASAQHGNFTDIRLINGDSVLSGSNNGTIYYDRVLNKFRFRQNGGWNILGQSNALTQGTNILTQNLTFDGAFNVRWGDTTVPLGIFDVVAGNSGYTQFSKALLNINSLDLTHIQASSVIAEVLLDATGVHLTGGIGGGSPHTSIDLTGTSALFTDTRTSLKGLEYAATGYVTQTHSLVDKEYADSGAQTLTNKLFSTGTAFNLPVATSDAITNSINDINYVSFLSTGVANYRRIPLIDYSNLSARSPGIKGNGQVVMTNGSASITGIGTDFNNATFFGESFWTDFWVKDSGGNWYRGAAHVFTDDTHIAFNLWYTYSTITATNNVNGGYVATASTTFPGVSGTYDWYIVQTFSDKYGLAFGSHNIANNYSVAFGGNNIAVGQNSFAFGSSVYSGGTLSFSLGFAISNIGNVAFAGGQGNSLGGGGSSFNKSIIASGNRAFIWSENNASQTAGNGALANNCVILGGLNHNIASGNVRAAIIGGSGINLTGTTYIDVVAVPSLAIFTTPSAGSTDDIITWNSTSKILTKVAQSTFIKQGSNTLTSNLTLSGLGVNLFQNNSIKIVTSTTTAFELARFGWQSGALNNTVDADQNSIVMAFGNLVGKYMTVTSDINGVMLRYQDSNIPIDYNVRLGSAGGLKYSVDVSSAYTTLSLPSWGSVLGVKTFTDKQTFIQTTTTSPINLGGFASDPSVGLEAELSYNTTSHVLKFYNGTNWLTVQTAGLSWLLTGTSTLTGAVVIDQTTTGANTLKFLTPTLGVTSVDGKGLWIQNATAAAAGAQQISGGVLWEGQGWATTPVANQSVKFMADVLPVQGAANPTGLWRLRSSINGAAYTQIANFTSTGQLLIATGASSGASNFLQVLGNIAINSSSGVMGMSMQVAGQDVYFDAPLAAGGINLRTNGSTIAGSFTSLQNFNIGVATGNNLARLYVLQPALISANGLPAFQVDGGAHTSLTASTEVLFANFNSSATVQYAAGAQTILRNALVQAPTIRFTGASVITDNATFTISGAPKAGTNTTQTNAHGLLIQAGAVTSAGAAFGLTSNAPTGGTLNYSAQFLGGIGVTFSQVAQSTTHTFISFTQSAHNGGTPLLASFIGAAHTTLAAGTSYAAVQFNLAQTVQFASNTTVSTAFGLDIRPTQYAFVTAGGTITSAASINVLGAPVTSTNAIITDSHGILIQSASVGSGTNSYGITANAMTGATNNYSANLLGAVKISSGTTAVQLQITQGTLSSGTPTALILSGAPHVTLTASVESNDVNFALNRIVQFNTGAQTLLRSILFQPPRYEFVGASTITDAEFMYISYSQAGNNATITNSHALYIGSRSVIAGTGAVTNSYGITVNAATGATNNYAGQVIGGSWLLAAGTTTYAPLLLPSGTNLTTPLAGAVENNGTNLFFTPVATRLAIGINASVAAPATTGTMTTTLTNLTVMTITPTGACTFNASGGIAGQQCSFVVTTSGTTAFVLTWGTNYKTIGTLSTGTVTAKVFTVNFVYDGTNWNEQSRTTAM